MQDNLWDTQNQGVENIRLERYLLTNLPHNGLENKDGLDPDGQDDLRLAASHGRCIPALLELGRFYNHLPLRRPLQKFLALSLHSDMVGQNNSTKKPGKQQALQYW